MKSREFKRIWGKPFDWFYLLKLEQRKLLEMRNYFNKYRRVKGWEYQVRDCDLCIKLIDIILQEDKYYKSWINSHLTDKGRTPFPVHINTRNIKRFRYIIKHKDHLIYYAYLANYRCTKALYLYNKIRSYKLFTLWD